MAQIDRLKQGAQVGFVYIFLYGLLFGYVTWTMYYSCGPSIFTSVFSGIVVLYTFYSTINFWGEKFILLWIILFILSSSAFILGILSSLNSCKQSIESPLLFIDNGQKEYQWVYQIYFPDIALLPWIFILGFTSMRYFFVKWKLVKLFFVFLSYNAFFIGIGIYIIGYYILEQHEEYIIIWQLAIIIICIGSFPCCLYIIYCIIIDCCFCCCCCDSCIIYFGDNDEEDIDDQMSHYGDDDKQQHYNRKSIEMRRAKKGRSHSEQEEISMDDEVFNPYQPFTIWVAIQMITSFMDLWSDILYVLLSDFYSPYLKIACWIFIFFQLIPDFFVLLQIVSDPERYDDSDNNQIIWFPIRKKWAEHSHVLERTIFVIIFSIVSVALFIVIGAVLILSKIVSIISVSSYCPTISPLNLLWLNNTIYLYSTQINSLSENVFYYFFHHKTFHFF